MQGIDDAAIVFSALRGRDQRQAVIQFFVCSVIHEYPTFLVKNLIEFITINKLILTYFRPESYMKITKICIDFLCFTTGF